MERRDSTYNSAARSAGGPPGSGNVDGSTANQKLQAMCDTTSCTDQPGQPLSFTQMESSISEQSANTAFRSSSIALSVELISPPPLDTYRMYEYTYGMYLEQL